MDTNGKEEPYGVVLDDLLKYTYVPWPGKAAQAAAAEAKETTAFLRRWTEKGGVGDKKDDDDRDGDDIGDRFRADGRYLPNANRDITQMLDNVFRIYANDADRPPMAMGRKMVLIDRARRVKFGYKNPRPMTLAQGRDGGVNICVYQRRRRRPGENGTLRAKTDAFPPGRIVPRHRADTSPPCVDVLSNEFTVQRAPPQTPPTRAKTGAADAMKNWELINATKKATQLQRALAQHLLRQPSVTAVQAALRHLGELA
ncbi:hypothetical protein SCUCBS95973_001694 [Sporothrix curviconia]|uniref:Uncharacterized protein n=1 Tax=Sporothrix curviconia TaxID=1260050 RepID=A0ABP0B0T2_9PEZI